MKPVLRLEDLDTNYHARRLGFQNPYDSWSDLVSD